MGDLGESSSALDLRSITTSTGRKIWCIFLVVLGHTSAMLFVVLGMLLVEYTINSFAHHQIIIWDILPLRYIFEAIDVTMILVFAWDSIQDARKHLKGM
jgi:hypothetical protein